MTRLAKNFGLAMLCMVLVAGARADQLSEDLKREYQKHVLGVRYPIHGGNQEFDSNGHPANPGPTSDWEIYGGVLIEKVRLKKDELRLEGVRVAPSDRMQQGQPVTILGGKTNFDIHLDHPLTSIEEAKAVLGRVFYLGEEDAEHCKPEFRRSSGSNPNPLVISEGKGPSGYVAPLPHYTPEPEFSEAARQASIQGTELLSIVIESDGTISSVKIDRGLGYGLDQTAVEAVRTWRFTPAMVDGQPVSMRFSIEVAFQLDAKPGR